MSDWAIDVGARVRVCGQPDDAGGIVVAQAPGSPRVWQVRPLEGLAAGQLVPWAESELERITWPGRPADPDRDMADAIALALHELQPLNTAAREATVRRVRELGPAETVRRLLDQITPPADGARPQALALEPEPEPPAEVAASRRWAAPPAPASTSITAALGPSGAKMTPEDRYARARGHLSRGLDADLVARVTAPLPGEPADRVDGAYLAAHWRLRAAGLVASGVPCGTRAIAARMASWSLRRADLEQYVAHLNQTGLARELRPR